MAITGNTSLNRVEQITGNFKLYFNLSAKTDTGRMAKYEIFMDDVSQGETFIGVPAPTLGNVEVVVFATNIGFHTFGVLFTDTAGNSEYFSETVYLDRNTPIIHRFEKVRNGRSGSNFFLEFDVEASDDTGLSYVRVFGAAEEKQVFLDQATKRYTGRIRLEVPLSRGGRNFGFRVECVDFSGNKITSSAINVYLNLTAPNVFSVTLNNTKKTSHAYIPTYDIVGSCRSGVYIDSYRTKVDRVSGSATGGSLIAMGPTFSGQISGRIPITVDEGPLEIEYEIEDEFGNVYSDKIPFTLDKTIPEGRIELIEGKKVGVNYVANVAFTGVDAGKIIAYGHNIDNPNNLIWNYGATSPAINYRQTQEYTLGEIGTRTIYGQFVDSSGNLSPVYTLPLDIDNRRPDAEFRFLGGKKMPSGDYSARFQTVAADNKGISHIKIYGYNANTGNAVSGHTNNWFSISETKLLDAPQDIIISKTEYEDELTFYFQAKDKFGNESPLRTANVIFDRSGPTINKFAYADATKTTDYYRVFLETDAHDNKGITHYRFGLNDVYAKDWIPVETTKTFNLTLSEDIPIQRINIPQSFRFQLRDIFGNETPVKEFNFTINDSVPEVDDFKFESATIDLLNYVLNFKIDAHDTGIGNVYWYSITANDSTTKDWKPIPNSAPVVSETVPFKFPLVNDGEHDFYLRVADMNKNESAVYKYTYDLDSVNVSGGIELRNIIKDPITYYANVELYAIDNRNVDAYKINNGGWVKIDPPQKRFNEYHLLPQGLTEGPRRITVQYRDTFFNETKEYFVTLNVDATDPTANIYANGVTSTSTTYNLTLDLDMHDNQELLKYKFWYNPHGEPGWTETPRGVKNFKETKTFTIPKTDLTPVIKYRVQDFFENEVSGAEVKQLVTTPPAAPVLSISNVYHRMFDTEVTVDYNVTAAANTTINLLDVFVNPVGFTELERLKIRIPNQLNAVGQFKYNLPLSETSATFKVAGVSDYGFTGPYTTTSRLFENSKPVANVVFLGAFEDNYDYILQFRMILDDAGSGLRKCNFNIKSYPVPKTLTFEYPFKTHVDEIVNIRIDQTHVANFADIEVIAYDMAMNASTPLLIPNVYLDRFRPAITNLQLNNGTTFGSSMIGVNKPVVPFHFEASDFSYITHYKFSREANVVFDHTWTDVPGLMKNIVIDTEVDLARMGFIQGAVNTLYVHAVDKFGNIGTAGISFEFDTIPPMFRLDFADRIERVMISGVDTFKIPYYIKYDDNYCEVSNGIQYYEHFGNKDHPKPISILPSSITGNSLQHFYLDVKHWGPVDFFAKISDRLQNETEYKDFNVYLENTAPVIWNGLINDGDAYTASKDVFIKMDFTDAEGVTEVLFSKSNTETWNSSTEWFEIPYAPRKQANTAFTVDLDALGFTNGSCNVHMYAKDFCQNVTRFSNTIMYDTDPPELSTFFVNTITRTIDTFEIELIGRGRDTISGWDKYYMSFSPNELQFENVPGGPVTNTTFTEIRETMSLPIKDAGQKKIYFAGKDAAGNLAQKLDVDVYIDNINPIATLFQPSSSEKYYLNATANNFDYIVSDDHALVNIFYQLNAGPKTSISNFAYSSLIQSASGTFGADFSGLSDGKHNIYLYAEDQFENRIRVPYEFILDTTPPQINTFNVLETRPAFNGLVQNYDVALELTAQDDEGIRNYELYDNGSLISSVDVDNKILDESLSVTSVISSANTELHTYELRVYDYANNMSSATATKVLHDGTNTQVIDFKVNGAASFVSTVITSETFSGNVASDVSITKYAVTTQSTIDLDSAFWKSFVTPATTIYYSENIDLSEFAISTHTGANTVYLHIMDDCGNTDTANVYIDLTDTSPIISSMTPTVVLQRMGKYYVGQITFDIDDPNNAIEAYAVGTHSNPTNFKSIYRTNNSTLTHSLKIAEDDIAGSQIFYLQLRDVDGNLSNNYRMSVRLVDFRIDPFEIKLNKYITGTEKVIIEFNTNGQPTDVEFGYQIDTTYKPNVWNSPATLVRTTLGNYTFDFDLNVTSISKGEHKLYVWLRDKNTHENYSQQQTFISEPTPEKPYAVLSILKTEYRNDIKSVWVNAEITDLGVGVSAISLVETGNPDNFENINIIQTGNYLKKFEYDKNDVRNIIYECKLRDAVNTSSFMFATSVDLTDVY